MADRGSEPKTLNIGKFEGLTPTPGNRQVRVHGRGGVGGREGQQAPLDPLHEALEPRKQPTVPSPGPTWEPRT